MWIDIHVHETEPIELLLQSMEKNGIDRAFVCSSAVARGEQVHSLQDAKRILGHVAKAQNHGGSALTVEEVNRALAKKLAPYGDRLLGFGKVDLYEQDMAKQLTSIVECGLHGIGEIIGIHEHVDLLRPVLAFSETRGNFPVFIHCDFPVERQDIQHLFDLIEEYPLSRVIVGHLGGNHWMDVLQRAEGLSQCLIDISEVVNYIPLYVAIAEYPDKVAFGSDFPWDLQEVNLTRIREMDLSEKRMSMLMGKNVERFLGWHDEEN